jgi:hypothetical protein
MLQRLPSFAKVSPGDLNRVIDHVNRVTDIKASPPLEVTHVGGGTQLRYAAGGFIAAVTARLRTGASSGSSGGSGTSGTTGPSNRYRYEVQEVIQLPGGRWEYLDNGRLLAGGIAVWEWNDSKVDVGTVVYVEPFGTDDWRFQNCCGQQEDESSSSSGSSRSSGGSGASGGSGTSGASGSSGGGCGGTTIEFVTGVSFDPATCTLTVTKTSVCVPACANVVIQ